MGIKIERKLLDDEQLVSPKVAQELANQLQELFTSNGLDINKLTHDILVFKTEVVTEKDDEGNETEYQIINVEIDDEHFDALKIDEETNDNGN